MYTYHIHLAIIMSYMLNVSIYYNKVKREHILQESTDLLYMRARVYVL